MAQPSLAEKTPPRLFETGGGAIEGRADFGPYRRDGADDGQSDESQKKRVFNRRGARLIESEPQKQAFHRPPRS